MKTLLYIGNKISKNKNNPTTIDVLGKLLENEGYKIRYASAKKNKTLRFLDMCFTIIRYLKSTNYILIDTYSTLNFWYAFAVSQISRIFNIPYIPILHGGNLPKRLTQNPRISKLIFRHAYANVAPSKYLFDVFTNAGYQNLILIPNSISLADYPFHFPKPNYNLSLLWVRSFAKIYNPKMAIKVFHEIQKTYPEASLTMVGPDIDGSMINCKKMANQLHLNINFTGKLSKNEWIILSKTHNYFINTSHFDNMPVTLIEAMALGLPAGRGA